MCLETTGGHDAGCVDHGLGDPKALSPVASGRLNTYPSFRRKFLEIDDVHAQFTRKPWDALLLHYRFGVGGTASLPDNQSARPHLLESEEQVPERVVMRRGWEGVGSVEVGLYQHFFPPDGICAEEFQGLLDSRPAVLNPDDGDSCLRF